MATAKKTKATKKPTKTVSAKGIKKASTKKIGAAKVAPKKTASKKVLKATVAKKAGGKTTAAKKIAASKQKTTSKKVAALKSPVKAKTLTKTISTAPKKATGPKGKAWLKPLDDRLLVEVAEVATTTPGGIVLVDSSSQPDNTQGYVLAVGRGHQNKKGRIRPVEVNVGDKIIFSKYAGDKVSLDGVNFVIIRETEILGFAAN